MSSDHCVIPDAGGHLAIAVVTFFSLSVRFLYLISMPFLLNRTNGQLRENLENDSSVKLDVFVTL